MKKRTQPPRRNTIGNTASARDQRDAGQELEDRDKVGEASEESFPASDAPSFTATTGSIANGRDLKTPKRGG